MLSDKISLVVLDMTGTTMVDNGEVTKCFQEACSQNGLNVTPEQIKGLTGWSKMAMFRSFWRKKLGADHPDIEDKDEETFYTFTDIMEAYFENNDQHPTEGALEVMEWLRENDVKVVLTTGFYREVTDILLENLGWDEGLDENYMSVGDSIIDMSIASDEVLKGRPQPFMIQKAMKQFGITDPKKVIKVGDTPVDLAAGRNAKCLYTLAVTNGAYTEAELAKLDNDGLLPTVGHLKSFLQKKLQLKGG